MTDRTAPNRQQERPEAADATAERERLKAQWQAARRRRDSSELGGEEYRAAAAEIGRLEVEIAQLDRSVGRV